MTILMVASMIMNIMTEHENDMVVQATEVVDDAETEDEPTISLAA